MHQKRYIVVVIIQNEKRIRKIKNGGFTMKLVKKFKLTYQYYKSLEKKKKPQNISDLNIRSDVYAFLTCPEPVIPSEEKKRTK